VRDIDNDNMQSFVEEQLLDREHFYTQAKITVKGENLDLDELVEDLDLKLET